MKNILGQFSPNQREITKPHGIIEGKKAPKRCISPESKSDELRSPISDGADHSECDVHPVAEIITCLNAHCNRKFKASTPSTQKLLLNLLKNGYDSDQIKLIIQLKASQWAHEPHMRESLTPKSLFNQRNYEQYLEEFKPLMSFSRRPFRTKRRKWLERQATLPKALIRLVECAYEDPNWAHRAMHLANSIYRRYQYEQCSPDEVIELARNYIVAILNGNRDYYKIFTKMAVGRWNMLMGVNYSNGKSFRTMLKKCKRYKLNKIFRDSTDYETVYYEVREASTKSIQKQLSKLSSVEAGVFKTLQKVSLSIKYEEIEAIVTSHEIDIRDKVMKRTSLMENGNIHYRNGNKFRIYKRGIFAGLEEFYLHKVTVIKSCQIQSLQTIHHFKLAPRFPFRDKKGRRLYHLLVNIESCLLKYVLINGYRIYEIDLANSQFCILLNFIALAYSIHKKDKSKKLEEIITDIILTASLEKGVDEHTVQTNGGAYLCSDICTSIREGISEAPKEIRELIIAGQRGRFYHLNGSKLYEEEDLTEEQLKIVKLACFGQLFGDYEYANTTWDKAKFEAEFPKFYPLVVRIKTQLASLLTTDDPRLAQLGLDLDSLGYNSKKITSSKGGSNLLSILLQRVESCHLFIDDILVTLQQQDFDALSKHDSIFAPENQKDEVYEIMNERLLEMLGQNQGREPNFTLRKPILK